MKIQEFIIEEVKCRVVKRTDSSVKNCAMSP